MPDSEQGSNKKKQTARQTAADKLLIKFEEGVRRLWSAKVVRFLRDSLGGRPNIPLVLGMSAASMSRGLNEGACSLESLIIALSNVGMQPSQLPNFESKSLQRLAGWWFAYLQLKAWRSENDPLFIEASKLFDSSGGTKLSCPLTITHNEDGSEYFTLSETVILILLGKSAHEWVTAADTAEQRAIAAKLWSQYRTEVGLLATMEMPTDFVTYLTKLQEKGLVALLDLQACDVYVSLKAKFEL